MATFLPSSGAISINDINSVFSRGNNLNAYRGTTYYTTSGGPFTFSGGAISMSSFYGTGPSPNFTLAYNNGDNFYIQATNANNSISGTITINTDGSISKVGNSINQGPTAYGSPLTVGVGSGFEFRVDMASLTITADGNMPTFTVAGVSYTSTTTTPWYPLSSNRVIEAYSGYADVYSTGNIEIRNISSPSTYISRAYQILAQGAQP